MTVEPDAVVRYRMERARRTLNEAEQLATIGEWNGCVNRLYYACFYAVNALLLRHGLSARRHSGVLSLFQRRFAKTNVIPREVAGVYPRLFETRQQGDYEDLVWFDEDRVRPWIASARDFITRVEDLITASSADTPDA